MTESKLSQQDSSLCLTSYSSVVEHLDCLQFSIFPCDCQDHMPASIEMSPSWFAMTSATCSAKRRARRKYAIQPDEGSPE